MGAVTRDTSVANTCTASGTAYTRVRAPARRVLSADERVVPARVHTGAPHSLTHALDSAVCQPDERIAPCARRPRFADRRACNETRDLHTGAERSARGTDDCVHETQRLGNATRPLVIRTRHPARETHALGRRTEVFVTETRALARQTLEPVSRTRSSRHRTGHVVSATPHSDIWHEHPAHQTRALVTCARALGAETRGAAIGTHHPVIETRGGVTETRGSVR